LQPLFWRLYVVAVLVSLKAGVHYFSTWVVMIKCFLLNPEKFSRRSVLSSSRKTKKPLNTDTLHSPKKMTFPSRGLEGCCLR